MVILKAYELIKLKANNFERNVGIVHTIVSLLIELYSYTQRVLYRTHIRQHHLL